MSQEPKFSRASIEPVTLLPALSLDMFDGKPVPPGLGKTDTPVTVLPPLSLDMFATRAAPLLQLRLALRAEATAVQFGRDCQRLHVLLSEYDLAHGGCGFRPMELGNGAPAADDEIKLTFQSLDGHKARERLGKMIETLDQLTRDLRALQIRQAQLVPPAA